MKIFNIIIFLLLVSCSAEKHLFIALKKDPNIIKSDTIYKNIPGETQFLQSKDSTIEVNTPRVHIKAQYHKGIFSLFYEVKDTLVKATEINLPKKRYEVRAEVKKEKQKTKQIRIEAKKDVKINKSDNKAEVKTLKIENKTSFRDILKYIAFIPLAFIAGYLTRMFTKK